MSNRTDFDGLASELVEMFKLDPDGENEGTGKLLWRLKRELHNAYVAGQETVGHEQECAIWIPGAECTCPASMGIRSAAQALRTQHIPRMPVHINLTIEHQPHAVNYQTVEEWLQEHPGEFDVSDHAQMIETGEVWYVQWYPRTPVGFQHVAASTLERAIELATAADPDDARP